MEREGREMEQKMPGTHRLGENPCSFRIDSTDSAPKSLGVAMKYARGYRHISARIQGFPSMALRRIHSQTRPDTSR
jgi:hypothetical protein